MTTSASEMMKSLSTGSRGEEITKHNHNFVEPNDVEEALMTFLRHPNGTDTEQMLTAGALMQELANRGFRGKDFSASNIGKAMHHLEFECKKIHGYNKYRVVIADYESIQNERKSDAVRLPEPGNQQEESTIPF